jgi:vesicle coat complex subunit
VDVDFVRKSIKAIGQTAVKIDSAAERCVNVLLDLIATRVSYVVQEAVVVMKVNFSHLILLSDHPLYLLTSRTSSENTHRHTKG